MDIIELRAYLDNIINNYGNCKVVLETSFAEILDEVEVVPTFNGVRERNLTWGQPPVVEDFTVEGPVLVLRG